LHSMQLISITENVVPKQLLSGDSFQLAEKKKESYSYAGAVSGECV